MRSRLARSAAVLGTALAAAAVLVPADAGAGPVSSAAGAGPVGSAAGAGRVGSAAGAGRVGSAAGAGPVSLTGLGAGYWHTRGQQILDSRGRPVRIAGINWYGFETPGEVAHGLWSQDYRTIINDVRKLGYNTIRIPFSNQMVEDPIVPQSVGTYGPSGPINSDLKGLNSLQILDKIIASAGRDGLKVILDDHRSEAGESAEQNGLWYTAAYTSQDWVRDWATLARRYAGDPTVIGFDLRNEPHTPAGDSYAQGATWGTGNPATDIRLAYEQAGDAILAADPGALIFCEGISENPGPSGTDSTTWWGGDLALAGRHPVTLSSPGHVVYSAHDYGPSLFPQAWFSAATTSASLAATWNRDWGYLYARRIAPVWVGEFGTGNTAADVDSDTPGSQGQWFRSLVSYLAGHRWMGWTYWALNGEDPYNLLGSNYGAAPASAAKEALLATLQFPLAGAAQDRAPNVPAVPAVTPSRGSPGPRPTAPSSAPAAARSAPAAARSAPASCRVAWSVTNSWPGGFQAQLVLTDTGSAAIGSWTLTWRFPADQRISSIWNATATQSGQRVTAQNASYDATVAAGGSVTIGLIGAGTARDAAPATFAAGGRSCS
jgi:endoglucanase